MNKKKDLQGVLEWRFRLKATDNDRLMSSNGVDKISPKGFVGRSALSGSGGSKSLLLRNSAIQLRKLSTAISLG